MLKVGISAPWQHTDYREGLAVRKAAGFELVTMSDHISFRDGSGQDGLLRAAMVHAMEPDLTVLISSYLLALRHPSIVARQLAELNEFAPGKLILGVGVGGDDRSEIEACGVDPKTRGARTDEALACLKHLQTGEPVGYTGNHFELDQVSIVPAVSPPTPILIAGRAEKTLQRAALHGDGWFGIFLSVSRFSEATRWIEENAGAVGRKVAAWQHGMQFWCCVNQDRKKARQVLAERMEGFYQVPFEKFERYCPAGTAEEVAEFVAQYVRAGAVIVNLTTPGTDEEVVEQAARVREILQREFS